MTKRSGKTLAVLPDGHPRRLADGRNAWRKMTMEQRHEFMKFIADESHGSYNVAGFGLSVRIKREGTEVEAVCDDCGERGELTGHDGCRGKS